MKREGVVTEHYDRIQESTNPAKDMTHFYCALFETPFSVDLFKAIARAIKMFGKDKVFNSILSLDGMEKINHTNIYPLLRYMCMKQLDETKPNLHASLKEYAQEMQKLSDKIATTSIKWKVRNPFDE
jgi:hypothetical protein